jgi:hypothetical protein
MYRAFFREIPEARLLFDLDRMIRDGETCDYGTVAPEIVEKSWVPSYGKRFTGVGWHPVPGLPGGATCHRTD